MVVVVTVFALPDFFISRRRDQIKIFDHMKQLHLRAQSRH
jgi:hypothetical protein